MYDVIMICIGDQARCSSGKMTEIMLLPSSSKIGDTR